MGKKMEKNKNPPQIANAREPLMLDDIVLLVQTTGSGPSWMDPEATPET